MLLSRYRFLVMLAVAGVPAGLGVGCNPGSGEGRAPQPEPAVLVVARVGDRTLTLAGLERELAARPGHRSTPAARERAVQEWIEREAMLARAREAGFDREPHVRAQMDRLLVTLWQEEQVARREPASLSVTDAEVRAFYEAHASEFHQPAAVRAGVIRLAVPAHASEDRREAMRRRAGEVREQALRANEAAFRQLVQQHSDDQSTRYIGGDTGWIEEGQPASRWEPAIVDAARGLVQAGDVAEVVETPEAFHVVRLVDRRARAPKPLDQVAEAIHYRLRREKEAIQQAAFLDELKHGLIIEINQSLLHSIPPSADSQAPPTWPGG